MQWEPLRVLVACEYSGRVRDAFRRRGHDAWSCDLLPTEVDGPHFQRPVEQVLDMGWDLMVAHPPCTDLAISGSRHFPEKVADGRQDAALDFVRLLMASPIKRWCIENPVSVISSHIRKPDQIIQPWEFGHGEVKATCLWLQNLPRLVPTDCVEGRVERVHLMPPGPDRWKERSRTYLGIAEAMGRQWGERALPPVVQQLGLLEMAGVA
jgi:site-specific DNA-cytosine methylase